MNDQTTPQAPEAPPIAFEVKNRSRADRAAKLLYGPTGRVWINRGLGVEVGTENGSERTVKGSGVDFAAALREDTKAYLSDDKTAFARARKFYQAGVDVTEFLMGRKL